MNYINRVEKISHHKKKIEFIFIKTFKSKKAYLEYGSI